MLRRHRTSRLSSATLGLGKHLLDGLVEGVADSLKRGAARASGLSESAEHLIDLLNQLLWAATATFTAFGRRSFGGCSLRRRHTLGHGVIPVKTLLS